MAGIIQKLAQALGKSTDEVMETLQKQGRIVTSGADEIDMGDIADPAIKRGRPAKSPMIDPNEIDLGKAPKQGLEVTEEAISTPVGVNEIDMGDVSALDKLRLKKGTPATSRMPLPNELDLEKASRKKLPLGDAPSSEVSVNELGLDVPKGMGPNVDDVRLPVKSGGLDPQGGGPVPALRTGSPDDTSLVLRKSTDAVEVGPEVIGKGTSKAAGQSSEAIEAELVKRGMNPRLAKIAIASGLVGGGAMMLGGGDEPPMTPGINPVAKGREPVLPENYMQLAQDEANNQGIVPTKATRVDKTQGGQFIDLDKMNATFDKAMAGLPKETEREPAAQESDFVKMLQSGIDAAESERDQANLLRASERLGYGIAGIKPDFSSSDIRRKDADRKVEQAKGKTEATKAQQSFDKAKKEINDEDKLRDNNSEISKTARELAKKLGISVTDKISAKQLQDAGLPLGTLLSTKMAADSRREMADLARDQKAETKEEQNKLKVQASVDKQVSQLLKSKDYEAYNTAKDAVSAVNAAIESGDKTASGSAFMQFAKIAQGDNSVVRDGDMAVLAGSYNYTSPSEMLSKLAAKARGGNFNEQELKQMRAVAERVQQIKGERVQKLVSPIVKRAEASNLNLAETLDPAVVEEFTPKQKELTTSSNTRTFKSPQKPGSVVTVKSGKKYRIGADGVTGTEIP